jgi:hypothetical protein
MSIAVADIAEPREDQRRRWSRSLSDELQPGLRRTVQMPRQLRSRNAAASFVITPNKTNNLSEWNILSNRSPRIPRWRARPGRTQGHPGLAWPASIEDGVSRPSCPAMSSRRARTILLDHIIRQRDSRAHALQPTLERDTSDTKRHTGNSHFYYVIYMCVSCVSCVPYFEKRKKNYKTLLPPKRDTSDTPHKPVQSRGFYPHFLCRMGFRRSDTLNPRVPFSIS